MIVPLPVTTTLKEERVVLAYSLGGSDAWFVDSVVLGVCGEGGRVWKRVVLLLTVTRKQRREKEGDGQVLLSPLRTCSQRTRLPSGSSHVPKGLLLPLAGTNPQYLGLWGTFISQAKQTEKGKQTFSGGAD